MPPASAPDGVSGARSNRTVGAAGVSFLPQLRTVFGWELRQLTLAARTLWSVALFGGFAALAVWAMLAGERRALADLREKAGADAADALAGQAYGSLLSAFGWGDEGLVAELARDGVPILFVAFFGVASWALPMLVALVSYDHFSELSTRGARITLLRARRDAYFAGKALAGLVTVSLFLLAAWVAVAVSTFVQGLHGHTTAVTVLRESARAWLLMTLLAAPYLALTTLVSSLLRSGQALVATLAVWIGLVIAASWAKNHDLGTLTLALPWTHAAGLVQRYAPTLARSVGALVAITAVVYALAWLRLRKRDV